MSNIEERVVVLRFDNQNFERKTKESVESLNNLDSTIQKIGSGRNTKDLSKAVNSIDLSKVNKSVDAVSHRMSLMGVAGATAIGTLTHSAMGFGKSLLTAIPNQIKQGGLTRALNIEQAKFQIEGLKGNWDDATRAAKEHTITLKEAVNNAVRGTAYGLDEAARIASQLMASGIKDSKVMEGHLKGVAGLAAMTGGSFSDIGRIFAQVAGQGRMMGDQLLQISQRGINAAATIAQYINNTKGAKEHILDFAKQVGKSGNKAVKAFAETKKITEANVRDLVSAGVLDFKTFSTAMNEAFGEHATKANETYTGSLANMKAALSRIGADVQTQKLINLRHLFNTLTPIIDGIHEALGPFIDKVNKASVKMTDFAVKTLTKVSEHFGWIKKDSSKAAKGVNASAKGFVKASGKVKGEIKKTTGALAVSKKEAKAAWSIWNKGAYGTGEARKHSLKAIGLSYKNVQGYVNTLIKANFDLDKVNGKVTDGTNKKKEALAKLAATTGTAGKNANEAASKTTKLATAQSHAEVKTSAFNNVLKASANIFGGLYHGIQIVGQILKSFGKTAKKAFAPLVKFGTKGVNSVSGRLASASERFKNWIGLLETNKTVLHKVSAGATAFGEKIAGAFGRIKTTVKNSSAWDKIGDSFVLLFSKIKVGAQSLQTKLADLFGKIKNSRAMRFIKQSLIDSLRFIRKILTGAINHFASSFETFVNKLGHFDLKDKFVGGFKAVVATLAVFGKKIPGVFSPLTKLKLLFGETAKAADKMTGTKTDGGSKSNAGGLESFIDRIGTIIDAIRSKIQAIDPSGNLSKTVDSIQLFFAKVKNVFSSGIESVQSIDFSSLGKVLGQAVKMALAVKVIKDTGTVAKSIANLINSINSVQIQKNGKAKRFALCVGAIAAIVAATAMLAKVPTKQMIPAVVVVGVLLAMLIGLARTIQSANIDTKKMQEVGLAFLGIGAAMILIARAVAKFAAMKPADIAKGGTILVAFLGIFTAISRFSGQIARTGATFAFMALAINILIPAIIALAHIKPETVIRGAFGILTIATVLGLASNVATKNIANSLGFLSLALAVDILGPAIILLGAIPFSKALKGAITASLIIMTLAAAAKVASGGGSNLASIVVMSTMMGTIAASLTVLSFLDAKKLLKASTAISATMLAFAAASYMAGKAKIGILTLAGTLGLLTGAFVLLVRLNPDKVLTVANGLIKVALTMGVLALAFSAIGIKGAIIAAGGLVAFAAILTTGLIALGSIAKIPGVQDLLEGGGGVLEAIGSGIGRFVGGIVDGFHNAATKSLPEIGNKLNTFAGSLKKFFGTLSGIDKGNIEKLKTITNSLNTLTNANVTNEHSKGKEGIKDLVKNASVFVESTKGLIAKLGDVKTDQLRKLSTIATSFKLFAEAASAIPQTPVKGGSFKQIFTGVQDYELFIKSIKSFINKISSIKDTGDLSEKVKVAKEVATTFKSFAKAANEIPQNDKVGASFHSLFMGEKDIIKFAKGINEVVNVFSEINTEAIKSVSANVDALESAADVISSFGFAASKMPSNTASISTIFTGYKNIEKFAEEIFGVTIYFNSLSIKPKSFESKCEALLSAADVVGKMGTAANKMPLQGWSIATLFTGVKDISKFAEDIAEVATTISGIELAEGFKAKAEALVPAATAVQKLADAASKIPTTTTSFGTSTDYTSLIGFTSTIAGVAKKISEIQIPEGIEEKGALLQHVAKAIKALGEAAAAMPTKQTWLGTKLTGEKTSLGAFADQLKLFMPKLKGVIAQAAGLSGKGVSNFKVISTATKAMAEASRAAASIKGGGTAGLTSLAKGVKAYVDKLGSLDTGNIKDVSKNVSYSVKQVVAALGNKKSQFKSAGKNSMRQYVSGIKAGGKGAGSAARAIANAASKAAKGASLSSAGSKVGGTFATGIRKAMSRASSAGSALGRKAKSGAKGVSLVSAGESGGSGFARGLRNKVDEVAGAGTALGNAAYKAAKAAIKAKSPSKKFRQLGEWSGMGMLLGMAAYYDKVHASGYELGTSAVDGAQEAVSYMDDINPSITPVLNMSNIESGVGQINGMLSQAGTVNAAFQAQRMMNSQNDRTSVAATISNKLDRLVTKMAQNQGTTYNIGDVTLDAKDLQDVLTMEDFVNVVRRAKAFA